MDQLASPRYRPHASGVAIADVVEALGLGALDDPIARRWLGGGAIADHEREAVVGMLAERLVAAGICMAPSVGARALDEVAVMRDVILRYVEGWDALGDALEREALPVAAEDGPWLLLTFLRLCAVDLAVRGAAAGALAGSGEEPSPWSPPHGFDELVARARAALERTGRPDDERDELGDALEAGFLRVLEQAEEELAEPGAPGRAALLELVRRGTRASAMRGLAERLARAEPDPLWAADLRAVCEPWVERLRLQARRLAGEVDGALSLREIVERAGQEGRTIEEQRAIGAEALWLVLADHPRDPTPPERGAGCGRSFVLPLDDPPPERTRTIQRELLAAEDELDGTLEHGRRALGLAPDEPRILVGLGVALTERACERRYAGWEYHVDVGLALLRRATRLEPRWDRPWVEIAILLAELGAWDHVRAWVAGIPAEVHASDRLLRLRVMLPGSPYGALRGSA